MHIHLLGVSGVFMAGLALLARQLGHRVSGSDQNVYPPMSTQLCEQGVTVLEGYAPESWAGPPLPDLVVVGNALSRGNQSIEYLLDQGIPFTSAPQWLAEQVLPGRRVTAVAGTHGKTTTTAMLACILEAAGRAPGFLTGGVAANFGVSARLGPGVDFVLEADEYDSAFFDKRAKFVHYRPSLLAILNVEFDHADIYASLVDIQRQFHHLVRTIPRRGRILAPLAEPGVKAVLAEGCWSTLEDLGTAGGVWQLSACTEDWRAFQVLHQGRVAGQVSWELFGRHNAMDALAAIALAHALNVPVVESCAALTGFLPVARRMQYLCELQGAVVYDDFAHHPSAVRAGIEALRARYPGQRVIAVLDIASNTMRAGVHGQLLGDSLQAADRIYIRHPPGLAWDLEAATAAIAGRMQVFNSGDSLATRLLSECRAGDVILLMSNASFGGLQNKLLAAAEGPVQS